MNKKFKFIGLFICLSVTLTIIMATKVFATNYGSGDVTLALDIDNHDTSNFTIESVKVNNDTWVNGEDRFSTSNGNYEIVVTVSAIDGKRPRIGWGGNWNGVISSNMTVDENIYTITLTVNDARNGVEDDPEHPENKNNPFMGIFIEQEGQQPGGGDPVEPGPDEPRFDGKAYLVWSCENGGICFKHFDNIPNFDDGNSTFYKESDIKDDRTGEQFKVNAEYKGWSTDAKFNNWVDAYKAYHSIQGDINWANVNPADMLGDPIDMREYEESAIREGVCTRENTPQDDFEACVDGYVATKGIWSVRAQLQPLGEPQSKNAYVSYGDRNFKIVIYNDKYKGVTIGDLSDLNYYPAEWANPFLRVDQYDISETTASKPTGISTILLEDTVNIKELPYNNFKIETLEALDVPEGAVSIDKVNGEWQIVFSSNFYDNVVFKATDQNGDTTYFQIKRFTIDAWIKFIDNKPVLNADFYFDIERTYTDFDITAVIVYKDGSEKNIKLEAVKGIDDGLGNINNVYEQSEEENEFGQGGKGLKKSCFQYKLSNGEDRKIKKVYLNAEYKGSTDTVYAGAYVGSGRGTLANIYDPEED